MGSTEYQFFRPDEEVDITHRQLPHWEQRDAYYFITYRTADSIPERVALAWRQERDAWLVKHDIDPEAEDVQRCIELLPDDEHREFYMTFTAKWHGDLDACHGECLLRQPEISGLVAENLHHFDGTNYTLECFVIMPNHVHVLAGVSGRGVMRKQCRNWKKYSANKINERLGRAGQFWQWESFDHLVRSPSSLAKFRDYINRNPEKARLRPGEYILYQRSKQPSSPK